MVSLLIGSFLKYILILLEPESPVLVFPEETTSSGSVGILKFRYPLSFNFFMYHTLSHIDLLSLPY